MSRFIKQVADSVDYLVDTFTANASRSFIPSNYLNNLTHKDTSTLKGKENQLEASYQQKNT